MILDSGREALRQEAKALQELAEKLDGRFSQAVEWILACKGRVICCGVGKSGHIARKTAGTLSSTGTPSVFLHAAEAVHGDLGVIHADDVVVLYSHSGETDEIVRLFPSIRSIGAKTILIARSAESSAGRLADLVLETYVSREACPNNLAPTTSTTAMLALSDALAVAAMVARGFTKEDFAKFHPSGTLGKRLLLRVADVMRPLAECALCAPETPMLEVIRAITAAGAGMACVVDASGALAGIVSESDLRRQLLSGKMEEQASAFMNAKPTCIEPNMMALEALEVFQNFPKQIGEMPVLEEGRLLGVLNLKDLLRCGIV